MKRLLLLFVALLVAAPVMAKAKKQVDPLEVYKQDLIRQVNEHYTVSASSAMFELSCNADNREPINYEFTVARTTDTHVTGLTVPANLLTSLADLNGFCILGPVDTETRRLEALQRVNLLIEYFRHLQAASADEKLRTDKVVHLPAPTGLK